MLCSRNATPATVHRLGVAAAPLRLITPQGGPHIRSSAIMKHAGPGLRPTFQRGRDLWMRRSFHADRPQPSGHGDGMRKLRLYGVGALWAALAAYALLLAPNQTPDNDGMLLKALVGFEDPGDWFVPNPVFAALFNAMGVLPAIYACLIIPGGRSGNKVPAWPYVSASFAIGVFALLPYTALWTTCEDQRLPLPKNQLVGWGRWLMRAAETPVVPGVLATMAAAAVWHAATAGAEDWKEFLALMGESRLVHVTTLDFVCMCALAPFWMWNDAKARNWPHRKELLPALCVLPLVGPALYLVLRPKTTWSDPVKAAAQAPANAAAPPEAVSEAKGGNTVTASKPKAASAKKRS